MDYPRSLAKEYEPLLVSIRRHIDEIVIRARPSGGVIIPVIPDEDELIRILKGTNFGTTPSPCLKCTKKNPWH